MAFFFWVTWKSIGQVLAEVLRISVSVIKGLFLWQDWIHCRVIILDQGVTLSFRHLAISGDVFVTTQGVGGLECVLLAFSG